jgi:predicted 3-demethylubiquinone-9 3-methyltransferase (glyoxalase superfamily)
MPMTSICLWFNGHAEEAANYYVSLFPGSRITSLLRYGPGAPMPEGTVLTATFELQGREYTLLNGGPHYKLSPAVSIVIHCEDQTEVDRYWAALSHVPEAEQCGWVQDRFGVSWQVVPRKLFELLQSPEAGRSNRMMAALMEMKKLDLAALEAAFNA